MVTIVASGAETCRVELLTGGEVRVEGVEGPLRLSPRPDGGWLVDDGQRRWTVFVVASGERRQVFVDGEVYDFHLEASPKRRAGAGRAHMELLTVPMPAKVVAVLAAPGQSVRRGEILVKLEAMKMELPLRAPRDGTVRTVSCREGDLVQPGVTLLEVA